MDRICSLKKLSNNNFYSTFQLVSPAIYEKLQQKSLKEAQANSANTFQCKTPGQNSKNKYSQPSLFTILVFEKREKLQKTRGNTCFGLIKVDGLQFGDYLLNTVILGYNEQFLKSIWSF